MTDETMTLDYYDAGLLNNHGGGNIDWWFDYIREELGRAHAFYQSQVDSMIVDAIDAAIAERKVPEWHPIETAPMEGRILMADDGRVFSGYHWGPKKSVDIWLSDAESCVAPTHWMPLPAAPKVTP